MAGTAAKTMGAAYGRRGASAPGRRAGGLPGRTAAALVAALALGACGGSGGDDESEDGGGNGSQDVAEAGGAPVANPLEVVPPDEGGGAVDPDAFDGRPSPGAPAEDDAGGSDAPLEPFATAPGAEACSIADVKARVDFDMRDYYVFAEDVPSLSPAEFDTPQALIEALRVAPDVFSSVVDFDDFSDQVAGRAVDFGFVLAPGSDGRVRFGIVLGGSPAAAAGIERGDALVALDGEPVGRLDELGEAGALALLERIDAAEEGEPLRFGIERDGETLEIEIRKAAYAIDTLAGTRSFEAEDGTRVGYVPVLEFAESTPAAMDAAFARLADEGVEALVLDLRYNPGGLVFAASRLAAHVAGDRVVGQTFANYLFNERYARELNASVGFDPVDATLGLDRVVAIMTGDSASSSELAVNGLKPFIDVEVVGTRSFGKAFGSAPMRYCDVAINAMAFVTANAEGETVAGGIEPDCEVEDVYDFPLGDERDALTGAAYRVLLDGTCPSDVQARARLDGRARGAATALRDGTPRTAPAALDVR